MNLQVTGEQLRDALITATELRGRIFIRGTVGADGAYGSEHWSEDQIEDLRTILTVLATLADDSTDADDSHSQWQRAESINEIRYGDTIKVEVDGLAGYYTYPVTGVSLSDGLIEFKGGRVYGWDDRDTVYRIPAPIIHPDPDDDRTIVMYSWIRGHSEQRIPSEPISMIYDGANYVGYDKGLVERLHLAPENITSWEPAVVTPIRAAKAESDG